MDIGVKKCLLCTAFLVMAVAFSACSKSEVIDTSAQREEESSEVPEATCPLTSDLLSGTWVNEGGFVCSFDLDNDVFTDPYGVEYDIISIEDDHVIIGEHTNEFGQYTNQTQLPVGGTMRMDVSYSGDRLYLLDNEACRMTDPEGQAVADTVTEMLSGRSFSMGGLSSMEFSDDMTTLTGTQLGSEDVLDISFDGITVTTEDGLKIYPHIYDDEIVLVIDGSRYICSGSRVELPDRWLYYDKFEQELLILDYSGKPGEYFSEDPVTGEREEITDDDLPRLRRDSMEYYLDHDGDYYTASVNRGGIFYLMEGMDDYSFGDEVPFYSISFMIDMDSPYAQEMIRRAVTIDGDQGSSSEVEMPFADGSIYIDVYEDQWPSDLIRINRLEQERVTDYSDASIQIVSSYYQIRTGEGFEQARIEFDFTDGIANENTAIYRLGDYSDSIERIDTTFENGKASGIITTYGTYFLGDAVIPETITPITFFEVDPAMSSWALNNETGDIIDLVDVQYIRDSYEGVFVVDSVEDLASLTYFINVYPRGYDDYMCVWVDMVSDIDLTGYEWVPMGRAGDEDYIYSFSGIFCGNGHTIRGLNIVNTESYNAFFGDIYFATVIGLNIEDAYISGTGSSIMANDTSTTDYIDCHVAGVLPDVYSVQDYIYFPIYTDTGNNGYNYCSYSVINGNGEVMEDRFTENYPHPSSENDLENHFDPDHDGNFDYSEDYFFGVPDYR